MADPIGTTEKTSRRRLFVLAIFPALIYANTLGNSFQYDDDLLIVNNAYVHDLGGIGHFFTSPKLIRNVPLSGYRPITMASFSLNYAVGGNNAAGYHLLNATIHVANTLLVWAVALVLMRALGVQRSGDAALAVALLFAAHPINTQPVNYISGRSTLLVGLFSLACFLLYARSRDPGDTRRRSAFFLCSLAAYLCALLSKEEAVAVPGLFVIYELFRLQLRLDAKKLREIFLHILPFALLTLGFLVFVVRVMGIVGDTAQARGVGENLLTQAKVLFIYLRMIALPTGLSIDHVIPACDSLLEPVAAASVVGVLALLGGSLLLARSAPVVPFGIWWLIAALIPSSTLVALKLVLNEQRLYLAAVGVLFIAGAFYGNMLDRAAASGRSGRQKALAWGLVAILAVSATLTVRRNAQWRDPLTIWTAAVERYPNSLRANTQLADQYLKTGRNREALAHAKKAVAAGADVFETRLVLARAYLRTESPKDALAEARAAADLNPLSTDARTVLGSAYAELERWSEAETAWERALELDPENSEAQENLNRLKSRYGKGKALRK